MLLALKICVVMHKTNQAVEPVCKISGHLGIPTPKIAGGLPDLLTWESAGLPCFTPYVHRFMARMPTDFCVLPDLMTR